MNKNKKRDEDRTPPNPETPHFFQKAALLLLGFVATLFMTLAPEGSVRSGDLLLPCLATLAIPLLLLMDRVFSGQSNKENRFHFHIADLYLVLFILGMITSYSFLVIEKTGNFRYASNAFWLWIALLSFYVTVRLLRGSEAQNKIHLLLLLLAALAFAESAVAIHAYTIRDPALRRAYLADPEKMLAENGFVCPPDSPERQLLENRLLASTEPLGTYGLTNTLAGVLLPWLVLGASLVIAGLSSPWRHFRTGAKEDAKTKRTIRQALASLLFLIAYLCPTLFCLVLTKSRSGVLAFVFGLFLFLLLWIVVNHARHPLRTLGLVAVVFTLLFAIGITGALKTGLIDREVFSEAGKSLGYRLEYWTATTAMIKSHPFFGVGPGNFQTMYPHFMLPQSSETIADPHHFAFEIGSCFGLPALLMFFCFLGTIFFSGINRSGEVCIESIETTAHPPKGFFSVFRAPPILGGLIGVPFAFGYSFLSSAPFDSLVLVILPISILLIVGFGSRFLDWNGTSGHESCEEKRWWQVSELVVLAAILLNLCAAGGISFPCVIMTLWLFSALRVNRALTNRTNNQMQGSGRFPLSLTGLMIGLILWLVFFCIAFLPAWRGAREVQRLEGILLDQTPLTEEELSGQFTEKDRNSISLALMRYDFAFQHLQLFKDSWSRTNLEKGREHLLSISPNSASIRLRLGKDESELGRTLQDPQLLASAKRLLEAAVRFSPNDAASHIHYAILLNALGDRTEAQREKKRALELDDQMPHRDRKLPKELRNAF